MNRFFRFLCCGTIAGLWLLSAQPAQAQVTVGSDPNSATVKIDWPTVYYAAIDVSGDTQGDSSVENVLLGEDGSVVFSYGVGYEGDEDVDKTADDKETQKDDDDPDKSVCGQPSGVEYHVCTWRNGQIATNQATSMRTGKTYVGPWEIDPDDPTATQYDYYGWELGTICITLGGQIFTSKLVDHSRDVYHYEDIGTSIDGYTVLKFGWLFSGGNGSMQRSMAPAPPFETLKEEDFEGDPYWRPNNISYQVLSVSTNGGCTLVQTDDIDFNLSDPELGEPGDTESAESGVWYVNAGGQVTAFSGPWTGLAPGSVDSYGANVVPSAPFQVNNNGYVIGGGYIWTGTYVPLHNSNLQVGDPDDDAASDLNDANQVVVYSKATGDHNSGGYLWESGTNGPTKTYLRSKLPKYLQAQVTNIKPFMISEQATDGTISILGWVTEGDDDPGTYVVCTRDGSGNWSFKKAVMPSNVDYLIPVAINSSGELAFTGYSEDDDSGQTSSASPHTPHPAQAQNSKLRGYHGPKIELHPFGHTDDASLAGDLVPSTMKGKPQHFVIPKAAAVGTVRVKVRENATKDVNKAFTDQYALSVIQVTGTDPTTGEYTGSPIACSTDQAGTTIMVPTDTANHYVVGIYEKSDTTKTLIPNVRQNIWVVWAVPENVIPPGVKSFQNIPNMRSIDYHYYTELQIISDGNWHFVFSIQPSSITSKNSDTPKLDGPASAYPLVPGDGTSSPSPGGEDLGSGAKFKWDMSRKYQLNILNPESFPRGSFYWTYSSSIPTNQAVPNGTVVPLPDGPIGNDDYGNRVQNYAVENDNPYDDCTSNDLVHSAGQLSSNDEPSYVVLDAGGISEGSTLEFDFLAQEFVRLQIGSTDKSAWYIISDPLKWKFKARAIYHQNQWIDNHSTQSLGN